MRFATIDPRAGDFSSIVQVPAPEASIDAIVEFSHTFDAYGVHGSLERIAIVASRVWDAHAAGTLADCDLDDLRTALFMTQRGWHSVVAASEPDVGVEWELIEAINDASGGLVRDDRPILL
ncbi:MAG TPA: hypothetical protein VMY16_09540 [Ilumatobacteraceae bacterium]|nr:hypothetical protein [Ilumatobacteraceae bacterium]